MKRNYMTITYAYHFLAEAVIYLFLSIPIFHFYYDMIPYVSYTFIMFILALLYVGLLHQVTSYIPYLIVTPLLGGLFYVLAYPWWISIVFALLLTRSAITLRKESRLENEGTYLRIILIASIIIPLFIHDVPFILFVVSTLMLLIVGNIVRNMTVLPKKDRRGKSTWFLASMLMLIVLSITAMYFTFNGVRYIVGFIWGVITYVLTSIGSFVVYLLSLIPIPEPKEGEDEEAVGGEHEPPPEHFDSSETLVDHVFTWLIVIGCIIAAFFIIRFIIRLMKRSFKPAIINQDHIIYEEIDRMNKKKKSWKDRFRRLMPLPKDYVRKRMYAFEKKMSTTDHGRKHGETIEEWVDRTGWEMDFKLYQRVRYGNHEGTKEEAEQLHQMLAKIETIEEERKKE